MKIRVMVTAVVLVAALGVLSACGGPAKTGGDPESAGAGVSVTDDGAATDTQAAAGQDSADQSTGDQSAEDQTSDDGPEVEGADVPSEDTGSDDPNAAGDPEYCKQLIAAENQFNVIDKAFTGGDLASANAELTADMEVFQKLADDAPSAIAPAMQDIVTLLSSAQKALGGSDTDPAALAGMANMPGDVTAIGNYISNNCAQYAG